jgi:hypothetical protein
MADAGDMGRRSGVVLYWCGWLLPSKLAPSIIDVAQYDSRGSGLEAGKSKQQDEADALCKDMQKKNSGSW